MRALYTAATGMMAQELNVEVISNNIANLRTTGFKRQRADFQDLLYQSYRRVGTQTSQQGNILPTGVQVGSGVKTAATPRVFSQGSVLPTQKELDVAIRGDGFFQIDLPDGRTAYSRDGSFQLDNQGRLVTADGYVVQPGINVPSNSTSLTIGMDGQVSAVVPPATVPQILGQIQLARFINPAGLENIGDNLYLQTQASGDAITGNPNAEAMGNLLQSHLEQANVTAVTEISDLISAQRAYEMNARVVSAADQMLQSTTGMFR